MSLLFDNFDFMSVNESFDNVEIPVEEHMDTVTTEDNAFIACEFAMDMCKLEASLYMADAMLEHKSIAGEDVQPMVEATVKDFLNNAIEKIKKFAAKVLAWFKKTIEQIAMLAASGEKLKSKYGSKLTEKAKKAFKFEYDIPSYKLSDLASMENAAEAKSEYTKIKSKYAALAKVTGKDYSAKSDNAEIAKAMNELKEWAGTEDSSVVRDRIRKGLVDEAKREGTKPGEIANHINDYLAYIGSYKKAVDSMKKSQKEFEKYAKGVISSLEKFAKKNGDGAGKLASSCAKLGQQVLSNMNLTVSTVVAVSKEAYRDVFGVVRRLITYNPKKEGAFDEVVAEDEQSLFENAYKQMW